MLLAEFEWGTGGLFWSILWVFLFVIWFWLLISIFGDLFADHETSGWAKAGWVILVLILPFLGILLYLVIRGPGMAKRAAAAQKQAEDQFADYVRQTAGNESAADQLAKLAELHDKGKLSDEEYASMKGKVLSS
ncbi:MAG: hypothetical protein JJLCMIEE_01429 [Acidimicrobiales bacterium]|nr:MAG: SHOCT domain-containing protein [Actinomycetota bacterium]MBV6508369.1 hypothetical protein [Acidimicrobiales bacterium]RIK04813.1 MAG: hypothetical protein DCC48_12280 [Acidobacteriota bacterium]